MCLDSLANISNDLGHVARDIAELTNGIQLIFYAHGIIMPIVVVIGLVLNSLSLIVLCRQQFRTSPYSLLQCLCACDICILAFAIYSDTEPAIRSKIQLQEFNSQFLPSCEQLLYFLNQRLESGFSSNTSEISLIDKFSGKANNSLYANTTDTSHGFHRTVGSRSKVIVLNLTNGESMDETNKMLMMLLLHELQKDAKEARSEASEIESRNGPAAVRKDGRGENIETRHHVIVEDNGTSQSKGLLSPQSFPDIFLNNSDLEISRPTQRIRDSKNQKWTSQGDHEGASQTSTAPFSMRIFRKSSMQPLRVHLNRRSEKSWKERSHGASHPTQVKRLETGTADSNSFSGRQSTLMSASSNYFPLSTPSSPRMNSSTPFPEGVVINSRPLVQATERWLAYNLLTFNLGLTVAMGTERCTAVAFPFRARSLLTLKRSRILIITLFLLTLILHTPQYLKEVVLAMTSPERLQDDFGGQMLQAFRRDYEKVVVHLTSISIVTLVSLNLTLIWLLRRYKNKIPSNRQPGKRKSVDVNVTVAIVAIVFLQLPHHVAINVISTMSLEGFTSNVTSFTRVVVIIRLLYVTSSAVHCMTYCFLSRRFRAQFLKTFRALCPDEKPYSMCGLRADGNSPHESLGLRGLPCLTTCLCCCRQTSKRMSESTSPRPNSNSLPLCQTSMTSLTKSHISVQSYANPSLTTDLLRQNPCP